MARTKNLGVILTTIGAALVIPIILGCISNAHAESTDFSITVEPSASITLSSNSVNLEITPTRQGVYRSGSLTVSAATNSPSGYNLVMTTTEPDLVSDTLNAATNAFPHIETIAESQNGISAADFEASTDDNILNHWGIAIDSGNFNAMKTSKTIKTTAAAASADVTTISMASKLNLLTVPGKYSTTINFQITANPLPDTLDSAYGKANKTKATINGRQYYAMQDMSTAICEDVDVINDQLQVYDTRDNTIYTIGKLADERCWLLDNLALDAASPIVQTKMSPDNTHATQEAITNFISGGNPKNYSGWATEAVSSGATDTYTEPRINADNKNLTRASLTDPIDPIEAANDWKFGVYYNYCAASIGTYCYAEGQGVNNHDSALDLENDICPSSWRIPTGGEAYENYVSYDGEYQELAKAITGTSAYFDAYGDVFRTAFHLPLAGWSGLDPAIDDYNSVSLWSSTVLENGFDAFYLYADDGLIPNSSGFRAMDMSVRCVAY